MTSRTYGRGDTPPRAADRRALLQLRDDSERWMEVNRSNIDRLSDHEPFVQ